MVNFEQLQQIVLLTQDAKDIGWEFFIDNGQLKARDNNYAQNTTAFNNETQLFEWFEEQFDKKD